MNRLNALKKIFVFFFTELPCYSFISPLYYLFSSFSPVVSTVLLKEIFEFAYNIIKNDSNSIVPFFKYGTYFIMFHLINVLLESITSISTNAGIYERSKYLLNLKITEKSASLPLIKYEDENILDIKKRAEKCVESEHIPGIYMLSFVLLFSFSGLISIIGVMSSYHWSFSIIAIFTTIQFLFSTLALEARKYTMNEEQARSNRKLNYIWKLFSSPINVQEMRTMGFSDYLSTQWRKLRGKNNETFYEEAKHEAKMLFLCEFLRVIGYAAGITAAIYHYLKGNITIGSLGACIYAFMNVQNVVVNLFSSIGSLPSKLKYAVDYWKYLSISNKINETSFFDGLKNKIKINNLSFTYPNTEIAALKNISLEINKGESIVILGENGSGKTTLIKLLLGLYSPKEGEILFDDENLDNIDKNSFYKHITAITQDFNLYSLTLKENIALRNLANIDNEKIKKVAKDSFLDNYLLEELDSLIGKEFDGIELSVGQKQKIAVARSLYSVNELVFLDEPTSAIDPVTEAQILGNFITLLKGHTTIIVSHRVGLCTLADKIIVMKNGNVVEVGTHDSLINNNGEYSRLYKSQERWYKN